ncbi:putative ribosomal N-acetyltransferase YdaF [Desulfosporosinus acididurans]|uniref:Putative ribosomal N-acetyltransferase YdaF n=1 Tax=Desulfosporosinus acididurans TaxID=476652 RepID=A0A0J1FS99_9FIRM|nr:UDP-4-amino-4,6-dideoxy-N-acetyl-beta-L-altrosamine N-acetyltransferase [Desulfosporosinus acididurans]KLU65868.1 putative ribosomal N-acetyltransferase YdaF [Desulfosporosinus acididurans]
MVQWRKIQESDLEMIMNWRMRPDITRVMFTDPVLTLDGQREWFRRIQTDPTQKHWITMVHDKPVGIASLVGIDYQNLCCKSGGYIAERQDRDFGTVIAQETGLLTAAFDILKLNRIQAEVMSNNQRVAKMLVLNGYTQEGVLRKAVYKNGEYFDVIVCSMLKEEWAAGKTRFKYNKLEIEL